MYDDIKKKLYEFVQENQHLPKNEVVKHFTDIGYNRRSVYRWLDRIEKEKTVERKKGSGRPAKIATKLMVAKLKSYFNHKSGRSQRKMARRFNCHFTYIGKILKKYTGIRKFKKFKRPHLNLQQQQAARPKCRRMYLKYGKYEFIIDDESYFTLGHDAQPGNDIFYSSDISKTPEHVKNRYKKKFEDKIMVWLAISPRGMSTPYFVPSGLAVNQDVYLEQCIKKRLEPMIKKYYSDGNYVFWPDLASSHYANQVQNYLIEKNIRYVAKFDNPANVPKARPIEDFWANLKAKVYEGDWKAKNLDQLKNRIRTCLRNMDLKVV